MTSLNRSVMTASSHDDLSVVFAVLFGFIASAVQIRLVICDIFKNCFIFEEKILKEIRLSENSSILLEIQFFFFFLNNGGQKLH